MNRISNDINPWTIQACQADQGESIAICEGSRIVAIIPPEEEAREGEWSAEDKANANLIAAAPELVMVLKMLLAESISMADRLQALGEKVSLAAEGEARLVLAKAEGRQA